MTAYVFIFSSVLYHFHHTVIVSFILSWKDQDNYIESLLAKLENSSAEDVARLRESECKLQLQVQELTRRENVLNMRLATKQEEMRNLLVRIWVDKKSGTERNNTGFVLVKGSKNNLRRASISCAPLTLDEAIMVKFFIDSGATS